MFEMGDEFYMRLRGMRNTFRDLSTNSKYNQNSSKYVFDAIIHTKIFLHVIVNSDALDNV